MSYDSKGLLRQGLAMPLAVGIDGRIVPDRHVQIYIYIYISYIV